MKHHKLLVTAALAGLWGFALFGPRSPEPLFTGHGDPAALGRLFDRWAAGQREDGNRRMVVGLAPTWALSKATAAAGGRATLDLADGWMRVEATGLPAGTAYEAWLLDRHAPARPAAFKLGTLAPDGAGYALSTRLDRDRQAGFTLDAVAVVRAGDDPAAAGLLSGSPSLFQRLRYTGRDWAAARIGPPGADQPPAPPAFDFLLPKVAMAAGGNKPSLEQLIAQGHRLFTKETFGGNGRTCATCHRPDHNHTIDPQYIAKLPPTDPLFVAETNPALKDLEKPALLRQFGLFLANVDGFDKPGVMRGAPHLLALSTSLGFETKAMGGEFQEDSDYFEQSGRTAQAVGWSQDGAPDGGSLRDFAKGAVRQHLPRTLARIEGVDFRLPTEAELDALEAYMLSLGRDTEVILAALKFKSPVVERGKALFDQKQNPVDAGQQPVFGQSANCNGCHMNAGAMSSTTLANPTRDTGVERMRDQLHHLADPTVAYDGGFGQQLQTDCGPDFDRACYSDGSLDPRGVRPAAHPRLNRFNTPSLIEAADTAPFFHNNSVATLEEAVAYYNTDSFNNSPGAFTSKGANRQTHIDSSQVQAVALFLRSINALENIRSANALDTKALALPQPQAGQMVHLAMAETQDAIEVLRGGMFIPFPDALAKLEQAYQLQKQARREASDAPRNDLLNQALALRTAARADMVE
ncbi:hypothetical protein [Methylomagnum ishizawai]|uniref:hypothetical protein n=1 Tax=Methylomagnum ishizawai TaxID=1760988 RepID=UPI001C3260F8|nr:hypothetical protein [Methylomagnum ishizawai]BBL76485.1 hypothetical protein MishRS11D_35830 [Methylomagnum ishizawai]